MAASIKSKIQQELVKDPTALNKMDLIKQGKTRQFWMEDDLLWVKGLRLFMPNTGNLRNGLMREYHDTLWAEHLGWRMHF